MKSLFYKSVFLLDYLPKYGRLWSMNDGKIASKPRWRYQARGMWGLCILDRLDLLDDALEVMFPERRKDDSRKEA